MLWLHSVMFQELGAWAQDEKPPMVTGRSFRHSPIGLACCRLISPLLPALQDRQRRTRGRAVAVGRACALARVRRSLARRGARRRHDAAAQRGRRHAQGAAVRCGWRRHRQRPRLAGGRCKVNARA